jgi:hypothetical protein
VITERIMREARRVAQTEVQSVLAGRHEGRENLEDLSVDSIILKWIFKKCDGEACTGFVWLGIGTADVAC